MTNPLFLPLLGVAMALLCVPFFKPRLAGWLSFLSSLIIALFSLIPAVSVLMGNTIESANIHTSLGDFQLLIDPLSAWFIVIINIIFLAGSFYGQEYLGHYSRPFKKHSKKSRQSTVHNKQQTSNLTSTLADCPLPTADSKPTHHIDKSQDLRVHYAILPIFQASMIYTTLINDLFFFIVVWEMMSLTSFMLILFDRKKEGTLKAAMNYFIQMHISVVFLLMATFYLFHLTGGSTFSSLAALPSIASAQDSLLVFMLFFIGFGIKSGFIPFHTWLPHAHPAAPSHVSGIMSGVIIKLGIYGILRVVLQHPADMITVGWIIMIFAVASGLYGVMLAIIQHNLKKLLAYHSIENIGIIGMGIGMGALGIGYGNQMLAVMGFAGALLHTLNHSLFKSLLFFSAGNVYQATGTVNIEKLGGLGKKMPYTAAFFLISAIAICGLPPLNGFISEFIIFVGLFDAIHSLGLSQSFSFVLIIAALALIGGLAILCFTKAYGVVFQGSPRHEFKKEPTEAGWVKKLPMFIVAALIILIGLFPALIITAMIIPLQLFIPDAGFLILDSGILETLTGISIAAGVFIAIILFVLGIRKLIQRNVVIEQSETWGCGYVAPNPKMQYTASSYARTFRKLFHPLVFMKKDKVLIEETFPQKAYSYESQSTDRIEDKLISGPLLKLIKFLGRFRIFQNGQTQSYLMYGFLFIIIVLIIEFFNW